MLDLRRGQTIHPVIDKVLNALNEKLLQAKQSDSKVVLCLPIGWDSHQNETAACGKYINNKHWMTKEESYQQRFTDVDFIVFYRGLAALIFQYHKNLHRVFWQLEGGYEPSVYKQQIKNMSLIFSDLDFDLRNQYVPKPTGP